jgi:hypothetical protein
MPPVGIAPVACREMLEHFPISLNRNYVIASLVAAIHASRRDEKDVDTRDKPAHDGVNVIAKCSSTTES